MNVRKRTGAMGQLSTTQRPTNEAVTGVVAPRGKFKKTNVAEAIDNSVAIQPKNVGVSAVDNAVSWPGKFSY